jgi:hypothetical protein
VIVKKSSGITSVRQLAGRKASSASTSTAGGNLNSSQINVHAHQHAGPMVKSSMPLPERPGGTCSYAPSPYARRFIIRDYSHP